jgi:hypothetical protein
MAASDNDLAPSPGKPRRRRRRRLLAIVGVLGVAAIAFVLVYFEPQSAFIDDEVHETLPGLDAVAVPVTVGASTTTVAPSPATTGASTEPSVPTESTAAESTAAESTAAPTTTSTAPPIPANSVSAALAQAAATGAPVVLSRAEFFSGEHSTSGTALVVALPDGSVVVRFEDLNTSNGPDLRVVLSPDAASDAWKYSGRTHLGELKGNIGDQNYSIASDIDLTAYKSVVIWCERFSVAFGAAAIDVVA